MRNLIEKYYIDLEGKYGNSEGYVPIGYRDSDNIKLQEKMLFDSEQEAVAYLEDNEIKNTESGENNLLFNIKKCYILKEV